VSFVLLSALGPMELSNAYRDFADVHRWRAKIANRSRRLCGLLLVAIFVSSASLHAQQEPSNPEPPAPVDLPGQVVANPAGQCVEPEPMIRWEDYDGPMHTVIAAFTRKLDRLSVQVPHYKPGLALCSLEIKDKLILFARDSVDPVTFLTAGFDAGISQAQNNDAPFGQGSAGYAKRLAASYADQVQFRFFKEFTYPTVFSEDPRYYRLGEGSGGRRLLHALGHTFVAYHDNGKPMFNISEWLGDASGESLSNVYHPGAQRGFAPTARSVGYDLGIDAGFDIVREFWPELARKLRLPFRDENDGPPSGLAQTRP
jgi:hypothetical protein